MARPAASAVSSLAYALYEKRLLQKIPSHKLPRHVGVVVDGNRRWAKQAGTFAADGHMAGANKIVDFIGWCAELDISTVTLYMLSSENLNRSDQELDQLLTIISDTLDRLAQFTPSGRTVKVHPVGQPELLPEPLASHLRDIAAPPEPSTDTVSTATGSIRRIVSQGNSRNQDGARNGENKRIHVNVAVGYGGRQEIVDAVKDLLRDADAAGKALCEVAADLTPSSISQWLYTRGQPDPDLIIRTSGEQRLSGFLMWQSAYSEFHFCEALWPDFRRVDFIRALRDYASRQRRFGS